VPKITSGHLVHAMGACLYERRAPLARRRCAPKSTRMMLRPICWCILTSSWYLAVRGQWRYSGAA
jgi:hypothetical protein